MRPRFQTSTAQLFKLKTQIRAQINHLRTCYQPMNEQKRYSPTKRFYPKEITTLYPEYMKCTNNHSQKKHYERISLTPNPRSTQKKHYGIKNYDKIDLRDRYRKKSPGYSQKKQIPKKYSDSITDIGKKDKSITKIKPFSKKIIPQQHFYKRNLI